MSNIKSILTLVLLFSALLQLHAAPVWVYPNQNYAFYVSPTKLLRYVEVEWSDMGGSAQGYLYINGNTYGGYDVGNGMLYGQDIVPDLDVWYNINVFAVSGFIQIVNDAAMLYAVRTMYWDPVDLNGTPWYYNGWSMTIQIDTRRIVRYIEVDWRSNGWSTYGTLYSGGYSYGAQYVGTGQYLYSNLFIPDTDRWYVNNYMASNPMITITGGAAQIFAVRVVYGDSGTIVPFPFPLPPPGPYPQPVDQSYPIPAAGPQPTGGPHIPKK
ncbi:MAG: hypothetical protein PHQ23_02810 [Candidatus Wallbacteria bacterium]|nr:hypothetical protein [Candidatus Wallbacteria bacterium]